MNPKYGYFRAANIHDQKDILGSICCTQPQKLRLLYFVSQKMKVDKKAVVKGKWKNLEVTALTKWWSEVMVWCSVPNVKL
jgi:hypothetical protein